MSGVPTSTSSAPTGLSGVPTSTSSAPTGLSGVPTSTSSVPTTRRASRRLRRAPRRACRESRHVRRASRRTCRESRHVRRASRRTCRASRRLRRASRRTCRESRRLRRAPRRTCRESRRLRRAPRRTCRASRRTRRVPKPGNHAKLLNFAAAILSAAAPPLPTFSDTNRQPTAHKSTAIQSTYPTPRGFRRPTEPSVVRCSGTRPDSCRMFSIDSMLCRLAPNVHAAWCDACLRGSDVIRFRDTSIARFVAIDRLRAAGWLHVADTALPRAAREDAERNWTCATYCVDCADGGIRQPGLFDRTPSPPWPVVRARRSA